MCRYYLLNVFFLLAVLLVGLRKAAFAIEIPDFVPEVPDVPDVPDIPDVPEPVPDPAPDPVPAPGSPGSVPGSGSEGGSGEASTPFSSSDEDDVDWKELGDKVQELIDSISSLVAAASTSFDSNEPVQATTDPTVPASASASTTALRTSHSTVQTPGPNATLACEIYQSYNAFCADFAPAPTSEAAIPSAAIVSSIWIPTLPSLAIMTPLSAPDPPLLSGRAAATSSTSNLQEYEELASSQALCLCYSSTYYVPSVYDDAASVCGGYLAGFTSISAGNAAVASVASLASQSEGFCSSYGNVREALTASFGEYTGTTSMTAPAPTSAATASADAGQRIWMWAVVGTVMALCL